MGNHKIINVYRNIYDDSEKNCFEKTKDYIYKAFIYLINHFNFCKLRRLLQYIITYLNEKKQRLDEFENIYFEDSMPIAIEQ